MKTSDQIAFETVRKWVGQENTPGADPLRFSRLEQLRALIDEAIEQERSQSAAPELLEACRTFVQLSNDLACALTPEHIADATVKLTAHCHTARAVIQKGANQ